MADFVKKIARKIADTKYLGCGDSGCSVERPRGMATNGGCRCFYLHQIDPDKLRDHGRKLHLALQRLRQENRELSLQNQLLSATVHSLESKKVNVGPIKASEDRKPHKNWCDYPSGPCDCGVGDL